jgi:hypothetical protein
MRYGFILPSGDARTAADFAYEAEAAGWDGFFVYETIWGIDAWVSLTAAAMRTQRIRLGTMLTPLSRMRPWKLASETMTLDHLSNGRVILAVGLGAIDTGFAEFGEVTDRKTRAELLDEGLDILTGLWRGQPFHYEGKHYHIGETTFMIPPPTVQQPRIPIWIVGAWFREKSMRRVLKYDGLLPNVIAQAGEVRMGPPTPDEIRAMKVWIDEQRTAMTPFDIVMEGQTPGKDPARAASIVRPYEDAGATWWLESMWEAKGLDSVLARITQGPPREA